MDARRNAVPPTPAEARAKRLSAELRANLKRRKDQARARAGTDPASAVNRTDNAFDRNTGGCRQTGRDPADSEQ